VWQADKHRKAQKGKMKIVVLLMISPEECLTEAILICSQMSFKNPSKVFSMSFLEWNLGEWAIGSHGRVLIPQGAGGFSMSTYYILK
jgi:hypothetical protein